jgi:FKBP-type peptidyl-prolyl cis-trans isomerase
MGLRRPYCTAQIAVPGEGDLPYAAPMTSNLFRKMCWVIATSLAILPLSTMAESAVEKGEKFLKENAGKEGVKTLPSGLQYKVLKEGTGKTPKAADSVVTHYRGTLINGTEFDSSYKRNEPLEFPVGGVIKGWTEALQLMKEGSKWMLFVPSKLAYGQGAPRAARLDRTRR